VTHENGKQRSPVSPVASIEVDEKFRRALPLRRYTRQVGPRPWPTAKLTTLDPELVMLMKSLPTVAVLVATSFLTAGCDSTAPTPPDDIAIRQGSRPRDDDARGDRQYGAPVRVGNGRARSYVVRRDRDGRTVEVGVALDAAALQGLPMAAPHAGAGNGHDHGESGEYLLPLPRRHGTSLQLIELNWNPGGHEPPGIYDVPHFDFHFYTISKDERDAIVPSDPEFMTKAARFPAQSDVPAGFMVLPPAPAPVPAVPKMGVHWSNLAAPELQPPGSANYAPFTHTFIYGSWDGRFTFAEPMITRAYLLTQPDILVPVSRLPQSAGTGISPTAYRIRWDARAREYRIALSGLADRQN
jgi:Domain of unknown function (DUF5602)